MARPAPASFAWTTFSLSLARISAMGVSLLAVSASYQVLSPRDFSLFNLAVFFIALSSAVSQPLNRVFWAGGSDKNYPFSSIASLFLTVAIVSAGILAATTIRAYPLWFSVTLGLSAACYGAARVIERYAYGRLLLSECARASVLPILLFAFVDLAVVGVMWWRGADSLVVRTLLPGVVFFAAVVLIDRMRLSPQWLSQVPSAASLKNFLAVHLFSTMGGSVLFLGALITIAGMVERVIFYFFPPSSEEFAAAYLLALAYAIGLQTLFSLLFDLARARVYRDGGWQPNARRYALNIVVSAAAVIAFAVVSYPVLVFVGLVSPQVHWSLWLAMLVRGLALALSTILNVDHFQEGRTAPIIYAASAVLLGTLASQGALSETSSQFPAALIMLTASLGVIIVVAHQFYRRTPST